MRVVSSRPSHPQESLLRRWCLAGRLLLSLKRHYAGLCGRYEIIEVSQFYRCAKLRHGARGESVSAGAGLGDTLEQAVDHLRTPINAV